MIINLRKEFDLLRKEKQVTLDIIEKDFVLTWILYGISQMSFLREKLIFKGGTALKKCYFGDYRFSEDLDFTLINTDKNFKLEKLLKQACQFTQDYLEDFLPSINIVCKKYTEKNPHPGDQEAFTIYAQLPWHREPYTRIMIEVTKQEIITNLAEDRVILSEYQIPCSASIKTYSLEEIVAEKLRALLQFSIKLHERGWARSRARDYYDIWSIYNKYSATLNHEKLIKSFYLKCDYKQIHFKDYRDFFDPLVMGDVKKSWEYWLRPLISNLPSADHILNDLRRILYEFKL